MQERPGSGRCPGEGSGNPLQYSCLEDLMDRGAWWVAGRGVANSWHYWATSLSFPFMGPDAMILVFWTLSFKPGFSLLSLTFIKMLLRSFSLSGTRVVSSVYLTLLIFPGQSWFHLVSHPAWCFACCTLYMGLPWRLSDKESVCNADFLQCSRHGFNPWAGKISAEGNGKPLQYSCLGNPIDRGASPATVLGVLWVGHNLANKPPLINYI